MSTLASTWVGGAASSGCGVVLDSPYALAVLALGPLAYWQCQDLSGDPADSSGNALDIESVQNDPPTYRELGPLTSPCDFSILSAGGTRFVRFNPISAVVDDFTWVAWVYVSGAGSFDMRLYWTGASFADGWGVFFRTNGRFRYRVSPALFGAQSSVLTVGDWSHVAVVREAGVWTYYVNGAVDVANAGTDTPSAPSAFTEFQCGEQPDHVAHEAFFEAPLSAAQIAALYAAR